MDFGVDAFDVFDEENDNEAEVIPSAIDSETTDTKANVSSTKRELEDDAGIINKKQKVESILEDINLDELISQIKVHKIETIESCTHEVAVPPNHEYIPLENKTTAPAKEYKFVLDPFQKEAIQCIENNQSVLVSAHTSAGKTVVAEYAIACSLRDKQRVIYTTPIKALSNQKYREFYEEFKDVGLITGDVTINPTASVLIMTTEILRNMLYRGSEVMREVGWVIFDEIHYMRDKERGVVWEETLILLPDNVHYVFLSATIPNARQFVEWVAHLHHQPCHVVYTDYRPTPLQHYIFPAGGDGIHLVVNEDGQFKEDNFNRAMTCLQQNGDASKGDLKGRKGGVRGGNPAQSNIFKIVKMIMERTFAPVIIFSFSKKDCEAYAMQMSQLDFNSESERKLIDEVFNNAMDVLSDEDRKLPQVENVLPLLRRGIGIHHGGLLPILKETVEILFGEGLIKALFATETFAMGLNMPARTVLFTAPRKFDGKDFRWITSGEYIQMSGRAGRRGLDEKGIVILMIDEKVSPAVGKEIVLGKADPINSAFHLTYNMVLNLLRVEEINPEYMLERSFFQFQNQAAIPGLYNKVKELQQLYDDIVVDKFNQIASYHDIRLQLDRLKVDYRNFITKVEYILKFLQPGRMVKIKNVNHLFDWGVVINFKKKNSKNPKESAVIIVDMLLHISKESTENAPIPCGENEDGEFEVVPVMHTLISEISTLRLPIPQDLRPPDNRKSVLKSIKEVKKHFPDGIPLLDPIKDMGIADSTFEDIVRRIKILEDKLFAHPMHKDPALSNLYNEFLRKDELGTELKQAKLELKQAKSVLQMDELKCRKRVLRRMEYCTQADVIELKGRVACELNGADELLLTEMIFNGLFNALNVPQMTALLSCFVCDEKSNEMPKSTNELSGPLRQMQDLARRIAKVSSEANLELDEDSYVERFKPYLMDVVYAWCKGASFFQICKMTDIFEGSIIRCMRRLEEVLRQLSQAAKNIGNSDLENKFSEAIKLLKRDIVFAASLYL
ncbi:exosome RNA helicase MTR4 [Microplitis demolitor]|uniref:exosome RNA helicase MTR4 n=1 Tax=Microplitis demolitor TaxID=69319 RepID=UPI0004CD609F|nr:exosome RNA helicase MTR4 [Microplitis demolitor]